jgi:hypothetical protein
LLADGFFGLLPELALEFTCFAPLALLLRWLACACCPLARFLEVLFECDAVAVLLPLCCF